jgi:hypothetical protein
MTKIFPTNKTNILNNIEPGLSKIVADIKELNNLFDANLKRTLNLGSSVFLREQLEKIHNIPKDSFKKTNVKAYYVIPRQLQQHPLFKRVHFNIDHAANGFPIKDSFLFDYHLNYIEAIEHTLDKIENAGHNKAICKNLLLELIENANNKILNVFALRKTFDTISAEEWYEAIIPKSLQ